jgi:hypothetical protein
LPQEVGLVLGEEAFHHHLVGGEHAGVLEDGAEPGLDPVEAAELVELLLRNRP